MRLPQSEAGASMPPPNLDHFIDILGPVPGENNWDLSHRGYGLIPSLHPDHGSLGVRDELGECVRRRPDRSHLKPSGLGVPLTRRDDTRCVTTERVSGPADHRRAVRDSNPSGGSRS